MKSAWRWAFAVGLLVVLSSHSPGAAQSPMPAQDPQAGSRVFGAKGCSKCHAVNGVGGRIGPDLGRIARPRTFYDLAAAMWNHLPRMSELMREQSVHAPSLSPQEASDLIGFLFAVNYFEVPGNPDAGKALFTDKGCIVCHQLGGVGGVIGPSLDFLRRYASPIYLAAGLWNHAPEMLETMRAQRIEPPRFKGSELADLLSYLRAGVREGGDAPVYLLPGRPAEGRRVFVERRCAECHAAGGKGGRLGPDLADRALPMNLVEFAAAMWNQAPRMLDEMKKRRIPPPLLRPEEMADIVGYLDSVKYFAVPGRASEGREVVRGSGCLDCHSLDGRGGRSAGDLAKVKGLSSPASVVAALWSHAALMQARRGPKAGWPELSPARIADVEAFLKESARRR